MPTVPTLSGNRVNQQTVNLNRVSTTPPSQDFFGGGDSNARLNNAVENLANTSNKIFKQEQQKADQLAIIEADQKLSALETRLLYDKDQGVLNKRGKDSFSAPDTVMEEYNKNKDEIYASLTSDYQRLSFEKMASSRGTFIDRQVQKHVASETKKYDDSVTKSYVANEMNAAIENYADPERIQLAIDRQRGAIYSNAERNGVPEETIKARVLEATSKTHVGVISKIMNSGGDSHAMAYYKENKDSITGEDRIFVEKALKEGVLLHESQKTTDMILAKNDDMASALDKARQINDPEKRDEVVKRIKSKFADDKLAKQNDQYQNFQTAYDAVEANKSIDAVPRDVLANLSLKDKQALEKRAAQLKSGLPTSTDINTYYDLETMAGNLSTRQKFMKLNLLQYKSDLSESDFKHFANMQKEALKGSNRNQLDGIETKNSIIKNSLAAAGIETGSRASTNDIKKANEFKRKVDELVIEKQQVTGKKITNDELRSISDNLMTETVVGKKWFGLRDETKKVFELTPNDTAMIRIKDIPQNEIDKISNALRNLKIPVTDENIQKLYSEKLNKIRGGNG